LIFLTFFISEYEAEPMLRHLKKNTSPGIDGLPAWLFRMFCSYELANIVACIFNESFRTGTVPGNWLSAIVTPIPKVPQPKQLSDFRPISVTPLLSRIAEKLIVKRWLRPAIPNEAICDQFAFKPTVWQYYVCYCLFYASRYASSRN
jgi:hypothetical protein